jgi:hypothetical protein
VKSASLTRPYRDDFSKLLLIQSLFDLTIELSRKLRFSPFPKVAASLDQSSEPQQQTHNYMPAELCFHNFYDMDNKSIKFFPPLRSGNPNRKCLSLPKRRGEKKFPPTSSFISSTQFFWGFVLVQLRQRPKAVEKFPSNCGIIIKINIKLSFRELVCLTLLAFFCAHETSAENHRRSLVLGVGLWVVKHHQKKTAKSLISCHNDMDHNTEVMSSTKTPTPRDVNI